MAIAADPKDIKILLMEKISQKAAQVFEAQGFTVEQAVKWVSPQSGRRCRPPAGAPASTASTGSNCTGPAGCALLTGRPPARPHPRPHPLQVHGG